jgi:hypothetical protein
MDCHGIEALVLKQPLFYLIMASKHRSSDAGDLDMPKKSVLIEKEKFLSFRNKSS